MKVICLTGGLASGKSTASMYLEALGANVIDADKLGHRVYDPGAQAFLKVLEVFGSDIVGEDNHIDRRALGARVFADPGELKKLTDIVWPEIARLAVGEIDGYAAVYPDGVVVLEAAILFEAGWQNLGHETWVVTVERETAIERAMSRDLLARDEVEKRLSAQWSNTDRMKLADVVIKNDGSEREMKDKIEAAWHRLMSA